MKKLICVRKTNIEGSPRTSCVLHGPQMSLLQARLLPGEPWTQGPGAGRHSAKNGQPDPQPSVYSFLSECWNCPPSILWVECILPLASEG